MERSLIVVIPGMSAQHRERIAAAAAARGFSAAFFERDSDALPHLAEAEIVFGQSALLAAHAPRLRWLCTPSAGIDQFTAPHLFASPDAALTNSSGAYGVTIAEHIIMVTLELMRCQQAYTDIVSRRAWTRDLPVRSIRDSRVTLLGTGDIGQETALRLRAFSPASLTGVNRSGRNPRSLLDRALPAAQLDDALPHTDLLIASLPNTPLTNHRLDARRQSLLPDGAIIVNVGRGNILDQRALEMELRSGRLWAALDVFQQEPLPAEDSLWDCPHLLLTPHVAGNMTLPYTKERIVALFLEDFENYCDGRPLRRRVELSKGY